MERFIDKKGNELNVDDHVFVFDLLYENEQSVTFGRITRFERKGKWNNLKTDIAFITECSFENPMLHDDNPNYWKCDRMETICHLTKMTIADVIEAFELVRKES